MPTHHDVIADYRAAGRFVATPGRNVFLHDVGSGSPVIFMHGIPTYSYVWRDVVAEVALRHRALAPDLPGFGLSEKRRDWDYSVAAQADTIHSLLLQLEIGQAAIVCHDFGALVAAEMISRAPNLFTHVVILNTSLREHSWRGGASPLSLLRIPLAGELAMAFSRQWMLTRAMRIYVDWDERLTPEVMAHYWWPFEHGYKETLLNMSRRRAAADGDFERWREALAGASVPSLIVWGADDPTFTADEARDLHQLIPGSRVKLFEHANHFIQEDRPEAVGRLINTFLEGTL